MARHADLACDLLPMFAVRNGDGAKVPRCAELVGRDPLAVYVFILTAIDLPLSLSGDGFEKLWFEILAEVLHGLLIILLILLSPKVWVVVDHEGFFVRLLLRLDNLRVIANLVEGVQACHRTSHFQDTRRYSMEASTSVLGRK